MILFSFKGYGTDGTGKHWFSLPEAVRQRTTQYMIARWAVFPNVFWLTVNDLHLDEKLRAMLMFDAHFSSGHTFR